MFVGHSAVALLARRRSPSVPLGTFLVATFALDLIWPVLLLLGIEQVRIRPGATPFNPFVFTWYPWSHSLLLAIGWGVLATLLARWRSIAPRDARLIGMVVVSHWVLDFVTHVPDLPLAPGSLLRLGLGLWRSIPGTLAVEGTLYVVAISLYLASTRPRDSIGTWGMWSFLLLSAFLWAMGPWSPPPPTETALAWFANVAWLLIAWGAWSDRHRDHAGASLNTSRP